MPHWIPRSLLLALLAGAAPPPAGLSRGDRALPVPEAAPSASCGDCHEETHAAWSGSRHAASATNAAFRVAWDHARLRGWCLNCHAPLPQQQAAIAAGDWSSPLVSEGVSCAACHQRSDGILTATSPEAAPEVFDGSPHPLRYAPELAESAFCGGCHEFRAPSIDGRMQAGGALQSTWSEWASTGSSRTCQSCHLEGHAFRGRELMAEALEIEVEGDRLRLRLRPDAVAHAVPTGDPFRHLRLLACADDRCAPPLASWGVGRLHTFDGETWWPGLDRRLGPAGTGLADALEVALPEGAQSWQLRYRLASPSDLHALPPDEGELLLASGPLAPEGEP